MGQDISWPCASTRKTQTRRLMESKYEDEYTEDDGHASTNREEFRNSERMQNLEKIQQIIEKQKQTPRSIVEKEEPVTKRKFHQPPSPAHSMGTQSPFSFTDDSVVDNDTGVIFSAEEIQSIETFINRISEKHSQMMPSFIVPHPSVNRAVVVLQPMNTIANVSMNKQHRFYDCEKDLKVMNNNTAYQILVKFLKQQYEDGLEYLGYYLDENLVHHFIFCDSGERPEERTNLDFTTLTDMSQKEIQNTLNRSIKEHYKLKGVITLLPNPDSPKPLSFAMFEKKKRNPDEYILVSILASTFNNDGPNMDFSKKIDLGCQSDQLEIAGLITHHEADSLFLVFSRTFDKI